MNTNAANKAEALILISNIAPDLRISKEVTQAVQNVESFIRQEIDPDNPI